MSEPVRSYVRWMIRLDMPKVLAIEEQSFAEPWTEEDFLDNLRDRAIIGKVAEVGDKVVGFVIYRLRERRLELLNLAVDPAYRRRTVGGTLIADLAGRLSEGRRTALVANVREDNLAAQLFYRSLGFRCERIKQAYFSDDLAAYEFAWRIGARILIAS